MYYCGRTAFVRESPGHKVYAYIRVLDHYRTMVSLAKVATIVRVSEALDLPIFFLLLFPSLSDANDFN